MKATLAVVIVSALAIFTQGCAKEVAAPREAAPAEDVLMIANFDAGSAPNMLGGGIGAWDRDPADPTQGAEAYFDSNVRVGNRGYSLRIEYDVDSPNPAFNGIWMKLEGADFSDYSHLALSVRGDAVAGFTERFKIELKNAAGDSGMYMLSGVSDSWQEFTIPLNSFRGLRDFSRMDEFVIVFEDAVANPKTGAIYIDNIYVK